MTPVLVRQLGLCQFEPVWRAMQQFTAERDAGTADEIWLVQHPPVFTQGMNGKPEHILDTTGIPVVEIDRGGQVTYHAPGQLVVYCLFDLKRLHVGVRQMVTALENAVIDLLADEHIESEARQDAPGVYVADAKISALGLRVKRGCSYHGLSLNVDMDLSPFKKINPCGYKDLAVTQLKNLGIADTMAQVEQKLLAKIQQQFGFEQLEQIHGL